MSDFAVIIHPVNEHLIGVFDSGTTTKRTPVLKKILELTPPFYACKIEGTRSLIGKRIEGHFVMCPLLPDQILNHDPDFVLKRVIQAAKIAEGLSIKILGLAAYASLVGRRGTLIAKQIGIPLTTGTAYTIATAIEATFKGADELNLDVKRCHATVIGATGTIGGTCSAILANRVKSLTLVGRNKQRLSDLAIFLKSRFQTYIETSSDINASLSQADIAVCCTNTPSILIDLGCLPPGSIICDVSQPKNISQNDAKRRQDILVIDGGVVRPPGPVNFNFNFGLPNGLAFACIAETMILALEERYESFSLGGNVSLSKVMHIARLAKKHGFQVAELRAFGNLVTPQQIANVQRAVAVAGKLRASQTTRIGDRR